MTNPLRLVREWFEEAAASDIIEAERMALATATPDGRPSVRIVLMKGIDDEGIRFFTNYGSRKAAEIAANPMVSLCFPWFAIQRQVVVCGAASPVSRAETEAYWATRPRESQLGAWASVQSSVIGSREELEARAEAVAVRFPGVVPVPEFWGGYRVEPESVEFWQGGPGRLHDRLRYVRARDAQWRLERLAP